MPTLYMMVGAPGSGKSYFAKRLYQRMDNCTWISRDEVRMAIVKDDEKYFSHEKEVFKEFVARIALWMRSNYDVIADATHLNFPSRRKLVNALADQEGLTKDDYEIIFVVMDTALATCVARDAKRTGRQHVTEKVINDFWNNFRIPTPHEFPHSKEVWLIRA